MTLFRRDWRITVGTLRVGAPLRVRFEVERTLRATPNTAKIQIWNLTREHEADIQEWASGQVIVEAGHSDDRGLEQLFRGELFRARGGTWNRARGGTGIR